MSTVSKEDALFLCVYDLVLLADTVELLMEK